MCLQLPLKSVVSIYQHCRNISLELALRSDVVFGVFARLSFAVVAILDNLLYSFSLLQSVRMALAENRKCFKISSGA